jgi:O-antigen ligase
MNITSQEISLPRRRMRLAITPVSLVARPLYALLLTPELVYLAMLAVMLFRPPDIPFYGLDRLALALLVAVLGVRSLWLRKKLWQFDAVSWPLLALTGIAFYSAAIQPYRAETWSVFAAKWFVPLVLYHLAGNVFTTPSATHKLEIFLLVVLAYLIAMAVFFLLGVKSLIFPRFILEEGIGIHAGRARGPFLQAVANGVALNLLGLVAMDAFRRRRLRGIWAALMLGGLPVAVLATLTRAVWLGFALSIVLACFFTSNRKLRRTCLAMIALGALGLALLLSVETTGNSLSSRAEESSPVLFRAAMYEAGWQMFLEKPVLGWGEDIQLELERRVRDFHQEAYFFHNTFLEIAVQHGLWGLSLYAWMVVELLRLGYKRRVFSGRGDGAFPDHGFRELWPILMFVFLVNACFVVMNYQFVHGLLFTLAGILAAQNRRTEEEA